LRSLLTEISRNFPGIYLQLFITIDPSDTDSNALSVPVPLVDPDSSVWAQMEDSMPTEIPARCSGFSGKPSIVGTVNILGDFPSRREIIDLLRWAAI
jgi:hypothetical protein